MRKSICALSVLLACAATSVQAKVLVRYKFENTVDANGQLVVTNCAPDMAGRYDAKVCSYDQQAADNTLPAWGGTAANMPTYSDSFRTLAPHLLVQTVDGAQDHEPSGGALRWDGSNVRGGLVVDDSAEPLRLGLRTEANGNKPKFTVEALIRLDPGAAGRSGDEMFPILQIGNDMQRGFIFSVYQGRPFFRPAWANASGGRGGSDGGSYGFGGFVNTLPKTDCFPTLCDGRWHHIALTYNDDGRVACARAFIDGMYVGANRWDPAYAKSSGFSGLYYGKAGDAVPVVIGAQPYKASRTFWGEIAEIRITDTQLAEENRFMVPGAAGPVDDDTAVMLRFGENVTEGFGFAQQGVYRFKHDNGEHAFFPKNWDLRNAAYRNALQPRWYVYQANVPSEPPDPPHRRVETGDKAEGSVVRADLTTVKSYVDGHALVFKPETYNGVKVGDCINIPDAYRLPEGDFTVEVGFRANPDDTRTTMTLLGMPGNGFLSKLCVHNGGLLCRLYNSAGANMGDMSVADAKDGNWHHAAIVYRRHATPENSVTRYYFDSKLVAQRVGELRVLSSGTQTFLIGGYERADQPFDGAVDNFRITRRALEVGEFLSTAPDADVTKNCLEATFDDAAHPYAAGRAGVADGTPSAAGSSVETSVEIVNSRHGWVHDGEIDGKATRIREGGMAVRVSDSYLYWTHLPMMERDALTIEFFAKMSSATTAGEFSLVRFVAGEIATAVPQCGVNFAFPNQFDPDDRLIFVAAPDATLQNVASSTQRLKHAALGRGDVFDNAWHHWAVVMDGSDRSKVKLTVYRDYAVVATVEDANHDGASSWINGALNYPKSGKGCGFFIGHQGGSTGFTATYDDVRVSPGILPVARFLRFEPKQGLMVIVR